MRTNYLFKTATALLGFLFLMTASRCTSDNIEDRTGSGNFCDTSAVSFSQDIKSIIGQNCEGCHNGASASGGLNLAGHQNIQSAALSGSIMDRVQRPLSDPLSMPPNGPLSDCDQKKLTAWISEGALDN
ncbi:MAG: hypothetical protein CMP53_03815 [Flavobacteriales bacterium]|jgi:hypothetical protein|nr:hypothetical protein [Flavobacteriales bacterium]|tara:strand:- start:353 stop:739 length:387 start_codon:yes stop_codon:yes gene_type:complete